MSDYTAGGAEPVEDARTDDPPTVDEVLEQQREMEHRAETAGPDADEDAPST